MASSASFRYGFFVLLLGWLLVQACDRLTPPPEVPPQAQLLTVENGLGSGSYLPGTVVPVEAHTPPRGYWFEGWEGDTAQLVAPALAKTDFFMPDTAAWLRAVWGGPLTYALTVARGTGSGEYPEGDTVVVAADVPAEDSLFAGWAGDTEGLAATDSPQTTLVMPPRALRLTATYAKQQAAYAVSVTGGSGSGEYVSGASVTVAADPAPAGTRFHRWRGDDALLADKWAPQTSFVMPERAVNLEVEFRDVSIVGVSYSLDIVPLFTAKCNIPSCHDPGSNNSDLTVYQNVYDHRDDIVFFLETGFMPSVGSMTTEEIQLVKDWVNQGAPEN